MGYTKSQIDDVANILRALPDATLTREHSKMDAVSMLAKEIGVLQRRGYKLKEVAVALKQGGVEISTPTLKNYLQRIKQQNEKRTAPRSKTTSAASEKPTESRRVSTVEVEGKQTRQGASAKSDTRKVPPGSFQVTFDTPSI